MFFVPGCLISLVTFPGVIVHEAAHQLFCRIFRVAVFEVCYFRLGSPAGYVTHEPPRTAAQQLWIGIAPFFVNSVLGVIIALPGIQSLEKEFGEPVPIFLISLGMIWLGISIAMHAFPSLGDAVSIWKALWGCNSSIMVKLLGLPIVLLILLGALGSYVWLDVAYGIALTYGVYYALIYLFV